MITAFSRRAAPWALAVVGGVSWGACFGLTPRPWLAFAALVPLVLLVTRPAAGWSRPFLWGWLHGIATWATAMVWLIGTFVSFGGLPRGLAVLGWVLAAAILGFYHGLFVVLGRQIWRRAPGLAMVTVPAAWVVVAWLQGHAGALAFPWNQAAYAWIALPGALTTSAWIGAVGVSFLVLFANVGLAVAWRRRDPMPGVVGVLVPLLILVFGARWSRADSVTAGPPQPVSVIQPDGVVSGDAGAQWEAYQRLIGLTAPMCPPEPAASERTGRLIVWPESAAFPMRYPASPQLRHDIGRLADGGCRVLVNTPETISGRLFNTALLVDGTGAAARYAKRRLVPWGEYVPLGDWLPFIGSIARISAPFHPGTELGLMAWGAENVGVAICYEVVFPEAVAAQVRAGATVLVTVTNDAWYGDTAAPWQHLRAARFRAAENRRPLIRAALTGVSAVVDAEGRMTAELGVGAVGRLDENVRGRRDITPYTRAPWLVPVGCLLVCSYGLASATIRRRRR